MYVLSVSKHYVLYFDAYGDFPLWSRKASQLNTRSLGDDRQDSLLTIERRTLDFFCSEPSAKDRSSNLSNTTLVCGLVKRTPGISRDNRNRWCNATPRVLLILILEWDGISVVLHTMRICVLSAIPHECTCIIVKWLDDLNISYFWDNARRIIYSILFFAIYNCMWLWDLQKWIISEKDLIERCEIWIIFLKRNFNIGKLENMHFTNVQNVTSNLYFKHSPSEFCI